MTALDVALVGFGLLALAGALLAVTTRHIVHAALWLVVALGSLAGVYLVLGAEIVALVQLLVYVGAIVVLVLFALMVTRSPIGPSRDHATSPAHRGVAAVIAAGLVALLLAVLLPIAGSGAVTRQVTSNRALGADLFGTWAWPFELLSLLLLASLVAALAIARSRAVTGKEDA